MATVVARRRLPGARREAIEGFLYISPWIAGFLNFTLGPMLASLYYSLTTYNVLSDPHFSGLANYKVVFTHDRLFWVALERTAYYAGATVVQFLLQRHWVYYEEGPRT